MSRPPLLLLLTSVAIAFCAAGDAVDPATNAAVSRGVAYLSHQQQADGSFAVFQDHSPRGRSTAAAVLAFLSAGQTPTHGAYALAVHNGLSFLLRTTPGDGYFGLADESGMKGQGFILTALAEAYGMEGDPTQRAQIIPLLRAGLNATLAMQDRRSAPDAGGWGEQGEKPGKLVATAITVLSLRALQDAGVDVPADTMHRAAVFAQSCRKGSAFADPGRPPTSGSTAAGACILLWAKETSAKDAELAKATTKPTAGKSELDAFLAALDLIFLSEADLSTRDRSLHDALCAKQTSDGSWPEDQTKIGSIFSTSTAVLSLTVSYRLLPIYPLPK